MAPAKQVAIFAVFVLIGFSPNWALWLPSTFIIAPPKFDLGQLNRTGSEAPRPATPVRDNGQPVQQIAQQAPVPSTGAIVSSSVGGWIAEFLKTESDLKIGDLLGHLELTIKSTEVRAEAAKLIDRNEMIKNQGEIRAKINDRSSKYITYSSRMESIESTRFRCMDQTGPKEPVCETIDSERRKVIEELSIVEREREALIEDLKRLTIDDEMASALTIFADQLRVVQKTTRERFSDVASFYYAIRAMALGALGALITHLVRQSLIKQANTDPDNPSPAPQEIPLTPLLIIGSLVAVAAFGLFYTKTLSLITPSASDIEKAPEYWRITMLCLIAGAFAERIYDMVRARIDQLASETDRRMVQRQGKAGRTKPDTETKDTAAERKDAKQKPDGQDREAPAGAAIVDLQASR